MFKNKISCQKCFECLEKSVNMFEPSSVQGRDMGVLRDSMIPNCSVNKSIVKKYYFALIREGTSLK